MKFNINPYLAKLEKIELLQRWIMVHSIIYYSFGESVVTDFVFDNNCKQLMQFRVRNPDLYMRSKYFPVFKDFNGKTGFKLPNKLKKYDEKKFQILFSEAFRITKAYQGRL